MASVFNGQNLGILSIGHGERVINIFKHKSEEIKGIKKTNKNINKRG